MLQGMINATALAVQRYVKTEFPKQMQTLQICLQASTTTLGQMS